MAVIPLSRLRQVTELPGWRLTNHQLRKAAILKEVQKFSVGSRVLDVGCAAGDIAIEAAALGYKVKGIDLEEWRIALARQLATEFNVPISFEVSDASRLSKLGETYDLIIMGEILEHFYEPWKILKEIAHLCTPDAHLIVTTPNMASLRGRLKMMFLGMFPDHNPEHLYYYTKRRFREMLEKSPFEMVSSRTVVPMLIQNLGLFTPVERAFWQAVNAITGGLGENLLVVCRIRRGMA